MNNLDNIDDDNGQEYDNDSFETPKENEDFTKADKVKGDKVKGDKYEAKKIDIHYAEKVEATTCPFCKNTFGDESIREKKWIKCDSCGKKSYDPNYYKSLAIEFPNVPSTQHDEFKRLKSRVDNEIRLGNFSTSLELSDQLTDICPDAPHSFLYNALCVYFNTEKREIVKSNAEQVLIRLELAKEKFDKDDSKEDYNTIAATIAYHYFRVLQDGLEQISQFYREFDKFDEKYFHDVFFKQLKELLVCYRIYPDKNFLDTALEYLLGYKGFAWFTFTPNNKKYSSIIKVINTNDYKLIEKHPGFSRLLDQVEQEKRSEDNSYIRDSIKVDFSKVSDSRLPQTVNGYLAELQEGSFGIQKLEKRLVAKEEELIIKTTRQIIDEIKHCNSRVYNQVKIDLSTEERKKLVFVSQKATSLTRNILTKKIYLFPNTLKKLNNLLDSSTSAQDGWRKLDSINVFESSEYIDNYQATSLFKDLEIITNDRIIPVKQPVYYKKKDVIKNTCDNCKGGKYLTCTNCAGKHKIPCSTCNKTGFEACHNCNKSGKLKCSSCAGKGVIGKGENRQVCGRCNGAGSTLCSRCGGVGRFVCRTCEGNLYNECSYCYGDRSNFNTYGKVDCSNCKASGELVFFEGVFSKITNHETQKVLDGEVFCSNNDNVVIDEILKKYSREPINHEEVFFGVNLKREIKHSERSLELSRKLNDINGITETDYPILLKESQFVELVPVIFFNCYHIFSQTSNRIAYVMFDSEPAVFLQDVISIRLSNSISEFNDKIQKAFFTKKYQSKFNKLNEIVLLLYVAHSSEGFEEDEKDYISSRMTDLKAFTSKEQDFLHSMFNSNDLPKLDDRYAIFTSESVENEFLNRVESLVEKTNGKLDENEAQIIEEIRRKIINNRSKRPSFFKMFFGTYEVSLPIVLIVILILWMLLY